MTIGTRIIRAPRGSAPSCKEWPQEAALRMPRPTGIENAFDIRGFVPEHVRPLFCEGKGPFRWVAFSGDPDDIFVTDRIVLDMFAHDESLCQWIRMARERVTFQELPTRFGLRFNELVQTGMINAPIVIGRDHLDSGSVASPYREMGNRRGRHPRSRPAAAARAHLRPRHRRRPACERRLSRGAGNGEGRRHQNAVNG